MDLRTGIYYMNPIIIAHVQQSLLSSPMLSRLPMLSRANKGNRTNNNLKDKTTKVHKMDKNILPDKKIKKNPVYKLLSNADLYVVRVAVDEKGEYITKMSKPCHHCICFLKSIGIRRVYYSTSKNTNEIVSTRKRDINEKKSMVNIARGGVYTSELISEIHSKHISVGNLFKPK